MKKIDISSDRNYKVLIDGDWATERAKIEKQHSKVLYILPESLKGVLNLGELGYVFFTADAEQQKNSDTLIAAWNYCGQVGLRRDDAIVAIGGGATTDLGGFVAATWLRGIAWYSVPTSLAGAIDAAIGGKTGINSIHGKNLIGSFYSPNKVIIDLNLLETLPVRDFNAGMAEVIKCGFISDPKIFELLDKPKENLSKLIYRSVLVKANVVSKDFKEGKLREILNYGHTLGHAIEKREKFSMRHGEAVAIGMVFAAALSQIKAGLSSSEVARTRELLSRFDLPTTYDRDALPELLEIMQGDKKVRNSKIRFIGIKKPGKVVWLEDVTQAEIKSAYERIAL
jgi:3-dehydroquinate synthase